MYGLYRVIHEMSVRLRGGVGQISSNIPLNMGPNREL
jgi:hypothetical protein